MVVHRPSPTRSASHYKLYTDASCKDGRLGWGFVLKSEDLTIEASGPGARGNNQSELLAVLEGLRRVPDGSEVQVHTDSVYVLQTARGHGRRRGFLRDRLREQQDRLTIKFTKVGKGPCPDHRKAHHLAREATAA